MSLQNAAAVLAEPRRVKLGGAWSLIEGDGGIWHLVFGDAALIQDEANARRFAETFSFGGLVQLIARDLVQDADGHNGIVDPDLLARLRQSLRFMPEPHATLPSTARQVVVTYFRLGDDEIAADVLDQLFNRLEKAIDGQAQAAVRHLKRGTTYDILATHVEVQNSGEWAIEEGDTLTVYQCRETGKIWARPDAEVADPARFEPLP
jgi:hypothetical protein